MQRHPFWLDCAAVLIVASLWTARSTAQAAPIAKLVAEVESLAAAGEADRALELALCTLPIVERAANTAQRQTLQVLIDATDPFVADRQAARTAIAKALLAQAQLYTRKSWHRAALQLLDLAFGFDANVAGKSRELVAKRVAANEVKVAAVATAAAAKRRVDVFESLSVDTEVGEWTRDKGGYRSPVVSGDSLFLIGASPRHQDARVRCEVTLDPSMECWAAILVGAQSSDDYFIIEGSHDPSGPSVCMTVWHFSPAGLAQLGQTADFCKAEAVQAPHVIDVRIQEKHLVASIGGLAEVRVETVRPVHGTVGLFLSGNTPSKLPVIYRAMTIDPIDPAERAHAVGTSREPDFASRFAAIERARESREPESATLLARTLASELVARELVDRDLVQRASQLLEAVDPLARTRTATMRDACARLTALAERYDEANRPRTSMSILADAARLDADTDAVALVRSTLAARALAASASELAAPAETVTPDVASETLQWLADAECHGTIAIWTRDEDAVFAAPGLRENDATILSARSAETAGSIAVQLRPSEIGSAGVVFGARSAREYWVADYTQRDGGRLTLRQRAGDTWTEVASGMALLDEAARSTWVTLEVSFDDAQLLARIGRAPPISAARPASFATGRLGLFASAAGGACHFRNLRFVPAVAK